MSNKYIEYIRAINKLKSSYCYICKDKEAFGIIANQDRIEYVCKTHYVLDQELREPTQISFE
jgi:hypothetical protein